VRPGRAADHGAAVMEEYSYTATHPLGHTGPVTGSPYLFFFIVVAYTDFSLSQFHSPHFPQYKFGYDVSDCC